MTAATLYKITLAFAPLPAPTKSVSLQSLQTPPPQLNLAPPAALLPTLLSVGSATSATPKSTPVANLQTLAVKAPATYRKQSPTPTATATLFI